MLSALRQILRQIDAMDIARERGDIGVVVLTGEGDKAFCSGGDQNVKGIGLRWRGWSTSINVLTCIKESDRFLSL